MVSHLLLLLLLGLALLEDKVVAGDALVKILDIIADSLKVGSGIVRLGDEDLVILAILDRLANINNLHEPVITIRKS